MFSPSVSAHCPQRGFKFLSLASEPLAPAPKRTRSRVSNGIPRGKLIITPIPGHTAQRYTAGEVPPYAISWHDKNGVFQTLNPGRAFVADPARMREEQTQARGTQFQQQRAVFEGRRPLLSEEASERNREATEMVDAARETRNLRIARMQQEQSLRELPGQDSPDLSSSQPVSVVRDARGRVLEASTRGRRLKVIWDKNGRFAGLEKSD